MSEPTRSRQDPPVEQHCDDGCCAPTGAAPQAQREEPGQRRRAVLIRWLRLLVAATISYNVIEAIVAIGSGVAASSAALIGFGLDSVVEVASAAAVAWQFSARQEQVRRIRERRALRIIAVSFFALAAYVTVEAVRTLAGSGDPAPSTVGVVLAALSLVIMPVLSLSQRRIGGKLGSASAVADSKQTLLCTYLSGVLLLGLLLNGLFGWSWADPVVALVIAVVAVKEGREAWRGDNCCAPGGLALATSGEEPHDDCCD
ncbi:cation transporter [Actinopolyspora halophila]|uniref:cation transporter n=1 Tax=Actinopolyspora halophila TaxID=1850 RepID=UPI0003709335|nr:cation transporter [Actinopolyspora halophila]